ncbi:hypothetical protein Daus18300_005602 [Diaporthe australafricana]|uniref:Uncharacterized protein n=1 Tax=Diaporthe australafricana TaxID=127596 RepID=A0ABR3X0T8_9PEZI
MASPFEIIALAETITGVGDKIYQFFSNVKDAPEEIREFCVELELLRTVLGRIRITSNRVFKTSASSHQAFGFETIFVVEKTKKSFSWVVKADEIDKAARRLDKTKQTLVLSILLSGMQVA